MISIILFWSSNEENLILNKCNTYTHTQTRKIEENENRTLLLCRSHNWRQKKTHTHTQKKAIYMYLQMTQRAHTKIKWIIKIIMILVRCCSIVVCVKIFLILILLLLLLLLHCLLLLAMMMMMILLLLFFFYFSFDGCPSATNTSLRAHSTQPHTCTQWTWIHVQWKLISWVRTCEFVCVCVRMKNSEWGKKESIGYWKSVYFSRCSWVRWYVCVLFSHWKSIFCHLYSNSMVYSVLRRAVNT